MGDYVGVNLRAALSRIWCRCHGLFWWCPAARVAEPWVGMCRISSRYSRHRCSMLYFYFCDIWLCQYMQIILLYYHMPLSHMHSIDRIDTHTYIYTYIYLYDLMRTRTHTDIYIYTNICITIHPRIPAPMSYQLRWTCPAAGWESKCHCEGCRGILCSGASGRGLPWLETMGLAATHSDTSWEKHYYWKSFSETPE